MLIMAGNGFSSYAVKCVGQEIMYKATANPNIFEITVVVYKKCSSDPICINCQSNCSIKIYASGSGFQSVYAGMVFDSATLYLDTLTGIKDAVALCAGEKSTCTNCGQRPAGNFSPGIEKYTFKGLMNISHVPTASCMVSFNTGHYWQRESSNNLTASNPAFYTESVFNRCIASNNNSPTFYTDALLYNVINQDVTYNVGAFDADGDSLFYGWAPVQTYPNSPHTYASPYGYTVPFPYLGAPLQSPPALPPAGINLNIVTGHLIYRPVSLAFDAAMCLEVREYRKFGNVYVPIGSVKRDINLNIAAQSANTLPIIRTYSPGNTMVSNIALNTCPNQQICFNIAAFEMGSDTIDLTVEMPEIMRNSGATLTHFYNSTNRQKFDSAQFCWTPPSNAKRNYPYYFSIVAKDRLCPVNGTTRRVAYIRVNNEVNFVIRKTQNSNTSWKFTCETANKAAIRFNLNQFKIETAPGSGVYTTIISDSISNYFLPTNGWYKLQLTCTGFNGCVVTENDSVFVGPARLSIKQQNNLRCAGDSNGMVELFYPSLSVVQYKIDSGAWGVNPVFAQLTSGNHKAYAREGLTIKDSITLTISFTYSQPNISGIVSKQSHCESSQNGEIILQGSNGILPYQYKMLGSNFQNNPKFSGLNLSTYHFICKDSVGCLSATISIAVNKVDSNSYKSPLLSAIQTQEVFCNKPTNGKIVLSGSYGILPYTYQKNLMAFQSNPNFGQLDSGWYTFTIKDSLGCLSNTQSLYLSMLNVPDSQQYTPTLGLISKQSPTCFGLSNGEISLVANGGTAPYFVKMNNGAWLQTLQFNQLNKGWKTFTIKDVNGCLGDTIQEYLQGADSALRISQVSTNPPKCNGQTGSLDLGLTGGIKPYYIYVNFKIDSVPVLTNTYKVQDAYAGYYQLALGDSLGCLANTFVGSNQIRLTEPEKLTSSLAVSAETCPGSKDGNAYFAPRGGISPYKLYNQKDSLLPSFGMNNLGVGYVYFTLRDSNNCAYTDSFYVNLEPKPNPDQICKLTVDSLSNKVLVYISTTPSSLIDTYKIFNRENNTQTYNLIGEIAYDSLQPFVVPTASNIASNMQYMVQTKDYCNRTSDESYIHKTVFIQQSSGTGVWIQRRNYDGYLGGIYQWYRSNNGTPFELIGVQTSEQTLFHDQNAPAGLNSYYVRYYALFTCINGNDYVRSNTLVIGANSLEENLKNNLISVYPNPGNGIFTVSSEMNIEKIEVYTLAGQKILESKNASFQLDGQAAGVYTLLVHANNKIYIQKISKLP